jgi:hypothetical protein
MGERLNRQGEQACACAAVNETARRSLAGVGGEHGQKDGDKYKSWVCARGSKVTGRRLWRGLGCGGSRSARREDVEPMPARCSTWSRPPERGRLPPIRKVQRAAVLRTYRRRLGEVSGEVAQEKEQVWKNGHVHGGWANQREGRAWLAYRVYRGCVEEVWGSVIVHSTGWGGRLNGSEVFPKSC